MSAQENDALLFPDFSGGKARQIRGEWRCIKSSFRDDKLPGRRGTLAITLGQNGFHVSFETSGSWSSGGATKMEYDPYSGQVTLDRGLSSETVYAPAALTKRKKLPIPERPDLKTFASAPFIDGKRDFDKQIAHKVASVETWPNPNRDFNEDDALVQAVCGWRQWVQPDAMNPKKSVPKCPSCY